MNKIFHKPATLLLLCLSMGFLASCDKAISKNDIDWELWKEDKNACKEYRSSTLAKLEDFLPEIQKMNENKILKMMGSPDDKNLLKRSQKEYRYFLSPGNQCNEKSPNPFYLWIRFGAIGNVSESLIVKE
jgi:hypothetical protein